MTRGADDRARIVTGSMCPDGSYFASFASFFASFALKKAEPQNAEADAKIRGRKLHQYSRLRLLDGLHQSGQSLFRITIEHAGNILEEQRVLQPGESSSLPTLQDNH